MLLDRNWFERRWRAGEAPFNGWTFAPADVLLLSTLRLVLQAVVGELEVAYQGVPLYRLLDWHAHDGHLTSAAPTEKSRNAEAVGSAFGNTSGNRTLICTRPCTAPGASPAYASSSGMTIALPATNARSVTPTFARLPMP